MKHYAVWIGGIVGSSAVAPLLAAHLNDSAYQKPEREAQAADEKRERADAAGAARSVASAPQLRACNGLGCPEWGLASFPGKSEATGRREKCLRGEVSWY